MAASCSVETLRALRRKVYGDIMDKLNANQSVDIKSYTKSVYDLIYSSSENEVQALNIASMVPTMINQLQAADDAFAEGIGTEGIVEAVLLKKEFAGENGLKNLREYLGIKKEGTGQKLKNLNKNQLEINFEQPQEEQLPEGFRYVEEGEILPAGDYETRISVDGKRTITNAPAKTTTTKPTSTQQTEQTKTPQPEPVYIVDDTLELSELLGDSIMQDVESVNDRLGTAKYVDALQQIGEALDRGDITATMGSFRAIIDGRLVVDFTTSDGRKFFMYKSTGTGTTSDTKGLWAPIPGFAKNGWFIKAYDKNGKDPKKSKYGIQTFYNIEAYLNKNEDALFNPGTEQNVKPEKPVEEQNTSPSNPKTANILTKISDALKKAITSLWETNTPPTFLSTTGREAEWKKGQDDYRVQKEELKFQYAVQRKLVEAFYADTQNDTSEGFELEGIGKVLLEAVRADQTELGKEAASFDPDAVQVRLVTETGMPVKFTTDLQPSLFDGKDFAFNLRKPDSAKVEDMVKSLANFRGIKGLTKQEYAIKMAALKQEILNEINQISQIREHLKNNPQDTLTLDITGGSMGYIQTSPFLTSKVSSVNESLDFVVAEVTDSNAGTKEGRTYVTAEGLYGQLIEVERPGIAELSDLELIKQLLFEDILSETSGPISVTERMDILQNYLDVKQEISGYKGSDMRVHMLMDADNAKGYKLLMSNIDPNSQQKTERIFDLTNPKDLADAKQAFDTLTTLTRNYTDNLQYKQVADEIKANPNILAASKEEAKPGQIYENGNKDRNGNSLYSKVGYAFRPITSKAGINSPNKQIKTGAITKNNNGDLVLSEKMVDVQEFMASQGFEVGTSELSADGKLQRLNSYFTFKLTDETSDKLNPKSAAQKAVEEQEQEQRNESVDQDAQEQGHDSESKPAANKEDRFNDMFGDDTEVLNRSLDQAKMTKKELQQKIDEAREWYEKSPLNKIFPFEMMFEKVNKEGVAQWTMAGITLFKGSDFTDLYHEAWHGFTQGFLTLEQKRDLYDEVKRKRGTFRDYEGNDVSFSAASDKQIEEYLAEEFRSYMLKGGKEGKKKVGSKVLTFFQKILRALEYLFTDSSYRDVYSDPQSDTKVNELFEKLRLGNLSGYSFSYSNAMFGKLNAGITALKDVEGVNQLNYQDSMDINEMVDYYIADYAILKSSTKLDRETLQEVEAKLKRNDLKQSERKELEAKRDAIKNNAQYLGAIVKSQTQMQQAYKWVLSELKILKDTINQNYLAETNENEKARLFKQKQTLDFAIEHFGDTDNLNNNVSKEGDTIKGVIGYHMNKTALFQSEDILSYDNVPEDQKYVNQLYSKSGNEESLLDLAKPEVIFLLRSLPDIKNGVEQKNKYGVTKLAAFNATWNRLARTLENTHDITEMYAKLNELGKTYEPIRSLIQRLGDPSVTTSVAQTSLQSAFFQTFAKARVPLVQMTLLNENGQYNARVGEAQHADAAVARRWQNELSTTIKGTNPYVLTNENGANYVNTELILQNFTEEDARAKRIEFYNALGFKLTDTPEIKAQINERKYDPTYFYRALKDFKTDKLYDYKQLTENESVKFKSLMELEAKYSDVFSNFAVTNAEGNTQFEHTLNNSMTIMINSINNAVNYDALINQPHMSHLDITKNPFAEASIWMKSLFDLSGTRETNANYGNPLFKPDGSRVKLKLMNLSGVLVQENKKDSGDGVSSASADKFTKMLMDLHIAQAGGFEMMRHADKGTSYAIKIDGPINGNTNSIDSYIPMSAFVETAAYQNLMYKRVLPHIIAEMKRMRVMQELATKAEAGEAIEFDYKYIKEGLKFAAFDNVLKSDVKSDLEKIVSGKENIEDAIRNDQDLQAKLKRNLNQYFDTQVDNMKKDLAEVNEFISPNLVQNVSKDNPLLKGREKDALIRSFIHNSWLHNIESIALLYGDLAQYNHAKEDFHKRNAGMGSTGTIYRTDQAMQDMINNVLWKTSYAKKLGYAQRKFNGQFNTAILEDQSVVSAYFKEYSAKDQLGDAAAAYGEGQNEGDAQGLISFDSYRQLKVAEGTWSNSQENLYNKIVKGERVNPKDIVKFFPVIKAQYWGPLANKTTIPITAFHKYSLFPLIPGVVEGTNAEKIHNKMMKEGIDYITFESGSKVGNITKTGNIESGKRNFDKAYVNPQSRILVNEILEDQTDEKGQYIPYFTKNTIHLEYLKNQLKIHDTPKGSAIFSTQLRKLIEDGLMKNGVPIDFVGNKAKWDAIKTEKAKEEASEYYKMLRTYERNLGKLTAIAKEDLLEQMNWTSEIVNGQEVLNGNIKDLISFVQKELTRQDLAQHEIDFLQFDEKGNIKHDLSLHTNVEKIEKMLNALMVKRLINQKVNGEGLIQVASTFMEKLADQEGRNFTNPTEADLKKYGSNDLPFYRKGQGYKGATSAMKVKVALQGDFQKLLKLKDKEGNIIGNRKRLNELIKDEAWLNTGRNREMVTMVAVRIPVQGLNSMEFMEVYEFLDPSAGSVIVPPTEIVTKSGADFDVDKMTVMMPNIRTAKYKKNEFGIAEQVSEPQMWNWTEEELKEEYDKYLEAQKEILKGEEVGPTAAVDSFLMKIHSTLDVDQMVKEEIEELIKEGKVMDYPAFKKKRLGKKAVENDLITNIKDILALPHNFKPLLTPNSTDLLYKAGDKTTLAEEYKEFALDFNPSDRLYGEERMKKGVSPTRALEYRYNLYKHQSNKVGKEALGLGAVDNTYNTLFNRIGAYMNYATVSDEDLAAANEVLANKKASREQRRAAQKIIDKHEVQTIRLPHNTMSVNGKTVISLSDLTSADGVSISDTINQMINGWVDVAKDAWIFNIQGNKEVAPTLLFMIQAGVPLRDAITLVSSPLVKEYIKLQQLNKSTFANPLGLNVTDPNKFRSMARDKILSTPKYGINLEVKISEAGNEYISTADIKNATTNALGSSKLDTRQLYKNMRAESKAKKDNVDYTYTLEDQKAFLHYLQLENMGKSVRDVKMRTNVDTSKDENLFAAQDRLGMLEALREDNRIPESIVDGIMNNSPISSFFIQGFQINLLGRLFPLRNSKGLNEAVREYVSKDIIDNTYGNKQLTVTNWKNDLISFMFQNELKYFDIDKTTHYKSLALNDQIQLEPSLLRFGAYVKEGVLYYDKNRLIEQFENKEYSSASYTKDLGLARVTGADVFNDVNEYIHYVLERESLRAQTPITFLKDNTLFNFYRKEYENVSPQTNEESSKAYEKRKIAAAYEAYLRDTAMHKIYNYNYLFKHSRAAYGNRFLQIKEAYPELAKSFDLMNALSVAEKGSRNLMLNSSKLTGDQKNILFENLQKLSDVNALKESLPNSTLEQRGEIADFFKLMPAYAFMQAGMNTGSVFSLNQFVSQDMMLGILSKPSKEFLKELNDGRVEIADTYLKTYSALFNQYNSNRATRIRGKNYFKNMSVTDINSIKKALSLAPLEQSLFRPGFLFEGSEIQITPEKDAYGSFGTDKEMFDAYRAGGLFAVMDLQAKRNERLKKDKAYQKKLKEDKEYAERLSTLLERFDQLKEETELSNAEKNELIDAYIELRDKFGMAPIGERTTQQQGSVGLSIENSKIKKEPHWRKDQQMAQASTKAIAKRTPSNRKNYKSSTGAYLEAIGGAATSFTANDSVWIFGAGTWASSEQDIQKDFDEYYKPTIDQAISAGVTTFNVGIASGIDSKATEYLKSKGFTVNSKDKWNELVSTQPSQQQTTEKKTYTGKVTSLEPNQIFVFGSNPEGRHGAGAAKYAADNFGAVMGQGKGLQGQSYALPTKDLRVKANKSLRSISKEDIISNIKDMYQVAQMFGHKEFLVSDYSGKNLNGYTGQEMADMFHQAGPIPANVIFNENFQKLIPDTKLKTVAKKGIDFVFEQNPELARIGTAEDYTEYLNTIFPNSKIKDIVYRGDKNSNPIEATELDPEKGSGAKNLGKGIYMAKQKEKADQYSGATGRTQAYIVNVEDFYITSIDKNWSRGYSTPSNLSVKELTNGKDAVVDFDGLDRDNYLDIEGNRNIGEYKGPVDVNGFPTYQEEIYKMPEWRQLAVQSNEQLLALGSIKDVRMFREYMKAREQSTTQERGPVEYKARTYNANRIEGAATANKLMAISSPTTSFVYNGPIEKADNPRREDEFLHTTGAPNVINLTTKQMFSQQAPGRPVRADMIRDVDGAIDPVVRENIDNSIENIKEHINQGQEIAFSSKGYGQDMLELDASKNQYAPKTFLYLSERLYSEFGYINPGYLTNSSNNQAVKENYAKLQENQNISDLEITEALDLEVEEFMKNCI